GRASRTTPPHPIPQQKQFRLLTAYPLARSVRPVTSGVNGHFAQAFVETSPQSWSETDIKGLLTTGKVSLDESKGDQKGPVPVAAAVSAPVSSSSTSSKPGDEGPKPETRVVVFGD